MIVRGWDNGNPDDKTGAGYGLILSKEDRDSNFKKSWESISIDLEGSESIEVNLSESFWQDCIELRSSIIGKYLISRGLALWGKNQPPRLTLEPLGAKKFYLNFNPDYEKEYSENSFWDKLSKKNVLKAGREVVMHALTLYFCLLDKDTPLKARVTILGALGYFVFPLDVIPDFTPGVGYVDDLGVLAIALSTVAVHIKPEHRRRAEEKLSLWFD
jgi:uncharacterized membrane protein YkvA (DUF1232 family)